MSRASIARRLAAAGCVYAAEEAAILVADSPTPGELEARVARRVAGEPVEHVVGWAEFRGLRFGVDAGLFVPRVRSEFLVEEAAALVRRASEAGGRAVVVDLCCGIGAIGGALAAEVARVELHAVDIDAAAIACAGRNVSRWGGVVHHGDLFAALPRSLRGGVDVVVASPPYVPTAEIRLLPAEARQFEPAIALDGGHDGLDLVERIARGAREWLSADGDLAVEMGESQVDAVERMFTGLGYVARAATSEAYGSAVVTGRRLR